MDCRDFVVSREIGYMHDLETQKLIITTKSPRIKNVNNFRQFPRLCELSYTVILSQKRLPDDASS